MTPDQFAKEQIIRALNEVKAPGVRESIVELNQLSGLEVEGNTLKLEVTLPELNPMLEKSLKFQIEKKLESLSLGLNFSIQFIVADAKQKSSNQIATFIAIGSGKGGVGKSSMTVNLASAFQRLGYAVGILDCDIYGPSIPTMLGVVDQKPFMLDGRVQPIEAFGFKIMSAGFFVDAGQSVIWRGPMIHKLIQQFVQDVNWGKLDILLIDLPPGTGDAPLSLVQTLPLTGAVMVSMPQKVSIIDVHKGISMFQQVKVPILGVIENMSHYECSHCHQVENIFDRGGVRKFAEGLGVPYLGDVPIDPRLRALSDEGRPFMADHHDTPAGKAIMQIAKRLQPFVKSLDAVQEEEIRLVL